MFANPRCAVSLSGVLDIPIFYETDYIWNALDCLEERYFMFQVFCIDPTVLERKLFSFLILNTITNGSARKKTTTLP
jgi:hypothetical protein